MAEVEFEGALWLFPDRQSGSYVLPVKRSVREAESIADGDAVAVALSPRATGAGR